jgi:hypothetical protein
LEIETLWASGAANDEFLAVAVGRGINARKTSFAPYFGVLV